MSTANHRPHPRARPVPKPPHLRTIKLGEGIPNLTTVAAELQDMVDVLLGREDPPIPAARVESLAEVASAYYARGQEINMMILEGERLGSVPRGSGAYKFRTGELRSFIELARNAFEMGSRRITVAKMEFDDYA